MLTNLEQQELRKLVYHRGFLDFFQVIHNGTALE